MFYESIGALLGRAAEAVEADDPSRLVDQRGERQRRGTIKMLRRISVIWPKLFQTLEEESAILEATLRSAVDAAQAHRRAPTDELTVGADPLDRYRQLLYQLDGLVIELHEHGQEPWAQDALRSLRRGLAEAAAVQGQLVDDMLAA